ncbi:MAG: TRAP transporter large permease subunit, partial [Alphaproteobacteria bacterium]|nr:TRAP transporter large permease subunit [Alphaproteobacteria bacterium]
LFIFMGIMLQRSKIAEDLLVTMAQLFGPVPGGLGISVVFVGALLAATTGIVGATVVAMGLISLPAMLRNNYSQPLATGTIAASGTLGQIIPPSIVLIILADQLASATDQAGSARKLLYKEATGELSMPSIFDVASTSAGEMFLGALVPGILLVLLYMLYILVFAILKPKSAPSVPYEGKYDVTFWKQVFLTLVPPLSLIFLVLGSIITGVATVNQAGAIGAAGALIMAGYRLTEGRKTTYIPAILALTSLGIIAYALQNYPMNIKAAASARDSIGIAIGIAATLMLLTSLVWSGIRVLKVERTLQGVMLETAKTTSLVFIILLGAAMLTAAFRAFGGEDLVRNFLNSLPGGFWSQFIIVMAVIFFLGFFLDFIEIAVVVVPIVAPILLADPSANITAVWLGVMIGLNIQTSFLTPPFGFALFYLRGVAPAVVKTINMYKGVVAFIGLQLIALFVVGVFPPLVNYLPSRVSFLSETSPPPRNPKLQICLEQYVFDKLADDATIAAAISTAQAMDVSFLPKKMAQKLEDGFASGNTAIASLSEAFAAADAVAGKADVYRPKLIVVRRLQKKIREAEAEIADLDKRIGRMRTEIDADAKVIAVAKREVLKAEAERLIGEIPTDWNGVYAVFSTLTKAESKARQTYRRSADRSFENAAEVLTILEANADYAALEEELMALRKTIEVDAPADTHELVNALSRKFRAVDGAGDVAKALSKARRELKAKKPKLDKAFKEYDKAIAAYDAQVAWRAKGAETIQAGLAQYLEAIRGTIGARMQPKLTREQALFLAACSSSHRDISLNF